MAHTKEFKAAGTVATAPHMTFEDVLELHGVISLPGDVKDRAFFISHTENLVQKFGKDWIRANRRRLIEDYEQMFDA